MSFINLRANAVASAHVSIRFARRVMPVACAVAASATSAQAVLAPSTDLPETIVTATRFRDQAAALPQSVNVITAEEIRASGATTVNEALMRLLGVVGRQDSYGGGDYALDLSGFGITADSNQVVVLDGIRISEGDTGGTRLAGIPIDAVERIEVMRGNAAVLYGEGATGGAIVITTKAGAGKARRNAASVQVGAGSLGLHEARANATVVSGGFSLDVSGQKRDSNNHRDNFRSQTDGSSLTAQWAQDNFRVGVRHGEDRLDTGLPGSLTAAQYAQNPSQTATPNDHANIHNEHNGVFAETALGDWQVAMDAGSRKKSLSSSASWGFNNYDIDAQTYAIRARHDAQFGQMRNAFVMGSDHGEWKRNLSSTFGSSMANQNTQAWYLKDDFTLASGTRLSAGWRTEQLNKSLANSSGNTPLNSRQQAWDLGLSQPLSVVSTVWARTGTSYRLANADEYSFTNPAVAIRPQTSRDLEAGTRWTSGAYKLEARVYRSDLTDEIGYDPNGNGPYGLGTGANINFDPTRRQGLELDGQWQVASSLKLRGVWAQRQSEFRSGSYVGKDVPLSPRQTLALRADWTPAAEHRVTGGVNWVSTQHPDFANQCTMPGHVTADVRYAYQVRNVEVAVGLNNLTDQKYYTQAYSCSSGVVSGIYPEAGRTVNASVRLNF